MNCNTVSSILHHSVISKSQKSQITLLLRDRDPSPSLLDGTFGGQHRPCPREVSALILVSTILNLRACMI